MISDLPRDLVEEILSRVPLKSMRTVRLTCKQWNTLSKNRNFSKMQIDKEEAFTKEGESQMIVMMNKKLYLMSVVINGDPYIELKGKLTCLTEQFKVKHVFNSEGLLFCILKDYKKNTKLMVWNPYCLQPKWFEPRCSYHLLNDRCCYGFGYVEKIKNKSCGRRSHKILRFLDISYFHKEEQLFWYEIYDNENNSWTTLNITPLWHISFVDFGITVKGNTYWCVTKENTNEIHIISFDFTKERFGPLLLLPYDEIYYDVILSCVKDEKLAALLEHDEQNPFDFEIWITTQIEAEKLTWSKFLTVNVGPEISCALESFIIDEEKKLAIGFDDKRITIIGECGYFRKLDLFEESDPYQRRRLCAYVPSLVQINQTESGKRKQQDNSENLEKRLCHEKMLRLAVAYEKRFKKSYEVPGQKIGFIRETK